MRKAPGPNSKAPLVFRPLGESDAQAILTWRYPGPYAVYDPDPADLAGMLDPANVYLAITTPDDEPLGFCCFGPDARVPGGDYADERPLDLGCGLRPDLTGRGLGIGFLRAILDVARQRFSAEAYRVTIAAFNRRAIRMCQVAGFQVSSQFSTGRSGSLSDFVVLTLSDCRAGQASGQD